MRNGGKKIETTRDSIKYRTLQLHKSGLNGAQAILQSFMEEQLIPNYPELIKMTTAWKGGIGGDTCSAFAGATLVIGFFEETREENLIKLKDWYEENYQSISCPAITQEVGGRPSVRQKQFCDELSAQTAQFLYQLIKGEEEK